MMNRPSFFRALTLALLAAIVFASAGCRRKTQRPITPLAEGRGAATRTGSGPTSPMTDGGRLTDPAAGGANARDRNADGSFGLPAGRLDRGAYNEDRAALAASTVFFDFDSSVIRSSEQGKLDAVAAFLAGSPGVALEIEGHTDERGTEEYNRALGERRALAVREALVGRGVNPDRLFTISYGKDRPAVDGHDESAWSRNRRAEFVVLTPR